MTPLSDPDDRLLARFRDGDAEAFVGFYRRHLPAMLRFFLRRTGDRELTADLTAEVFAAALIGAERYRGGERPALAWLYGIAAHKLADSRRRGRVEDDARRRLSLEPLLADDEDLARVEQLAGAGQPGARCLEAQAHALQRDARRIPAGVRAQTVYLGERTTTGTATSPPSHTTTTHG